MLDIEAKAVEEAHVDVSHPDESEPGDEVSAPVVVEHLESGKDEEEGRDVVTEAVFAGEQVEELANKNWLAVWLFSLQKWRGSRKTSSWVTVQEAHAMGRARITR